MESILKKADSQSQFEPSRKATFKAIVYKQQCWGPRVSFELSDILQCENFHPYLIKVMKSFFKLLPKLNYELGALQPWARPRYWSWVIQYSFHREKMKELFLLCKWFFTALIISETFLPFSFQFTVIVIQFSSDVCWNSNTDSVLRKSSLLISGHY